MVVPSWVPLVSAGQETGATDPLGSFHALYDNHFSGQYMYMSENILNHGGTPVQCMYCAEQYII